MTPFTFFLTTACVDYAGLSDDCYELSILRNFRDTYVSHLPNGKEILSEYYLNAPLIISRIMKSEEKDKLLQNIYINIREAIRYIEIGSKKKAYELYQKMYYELLNTFKA